MTQLAIIEGDDKIRNKLAGFLGADPGFEVVHSCISFENFREQWTGEPLDFVLCNIDLPGRSGIEATWHIKDVSRRIYVMLLTAKEERDRIFQALCAGASGYMPERASLSEIKTGIWDILYGGAIISPDMAPEILRFFNCRQERKRGVITQLTYGEKEVLSFMEQGFSNKKIAEKMLVPVGTIYFYIKNIYLKMQVSSRAALIATYQHIV